MKVIATKRGFDGIVVREVGEEFDFPGEHEPYWMKPVDEKKAEDKKATPAAPAAKAKPAKSSDSVI